MNDFLEALMAGFLIVATFLIISALATPLVGGLVAFFVAKALLKGKL